MAKSNVAGLLTSVDDFYTTQEERDNAQRSYVTDLPTAEISSFPNHPFHVRMDEEMERLVDSVKERGILSPVLVRPMLDGSYQMVSGHRRRMAAELAELPTVPCIVRELTDDEAVIIMVDSNLQREQVLPSEKAFAYKMKLDAMKRQVGRPSKNNSATVLQNFEGKTSRELLAEQSGESHEQIRKHIRLTNLIPELLDMHQQSMGPWDEYMTYLHGQGCYEWFAIPEEKTRYMVLFPKSNNPLTLSKAIKRFFDNQGNFEDIAEIQPHLSVCVPNNRVKEGVLKRIDGRYWWIHDRLEIFTLECPDTKDLI